MYESVCEKINADLYHKSAFRGKKTGKARHKYSPFTLYCQIYPNCIQPCTLFYMLSFGDASQTSADCNFFCCSKHLGSLTLSESSCAWHWHLFCSIRGAAGPLPDMVPLLHLSGRVPIKGSRFPRAAPAGPVRRLCPRVLLGLQGQLAPRAGLPGEQPAHHLLPARRKQVRSFQCRCDAAFEILISLISLLSVL